MLTILKQITNTENDNISQESVSVVNKIKNKNQTVIISEDDIPGSSYENGRKFNKNHKTLMDVIESAPIQRPRRTKVNQQKLNDTKNQ